MKGQFGRLLAVGIAVVIIGVSGATSVSQPSMTETNPNSKAIIAQGSSTVAPLTSEVADRYANDVDADVQITVNSVGSSEGIRLFGVRDVPSPSDIANSSRAMRGNEAETLASNGIEFTESLVGFDGLTVAIGNNSAIFADGVVCATLGELAYLWHPLAEGVITNWSQLGSRYADLEVVLSGAADTSGTFDFFTETLQGDDGITREDYFATEDDQLLAERTGESTGELTYFGFAFFQNNQDIVQAVAIDPSLTIGSNADQSILADVNAARAEEGAGEITVGDGSCNGIIPNPDTIGSFDYPITRPLFFYTNHESAERAAVDDFVNFYLDNLENDELFTTVGYVPPTAALVEAARECFAARVNGTAFGDSGFSGLTATDIESLYTTHCGTN